MPAFIHITPEDAERVRLLRSKNISFREIARQVPAASEGTIRRLCKANGWHPVLLEGEAPEQPPPPLSRPVAVLPELQAAPEPEPEPDLEPEPEPEPEPPPAPKRKPKPAGAGQVPQSRIIPPLPRTPPPRPLALRGAWEEGPMAGPKTRELLHRQSARAQIATRVALRYAELIELALSQPPATDEASTRRKAEALMTLMPSDRDTLSTAVASMKAMMEAAHRFENDAWKVRQVKNMEDDVLGLVGAEANAISGEGGEGGGTLPSVTPIDMSRMSTEQLLKLQEAAELLDQNRARPAVVLPPSGPIIDVEAD